MRQRDRSADGAVDIHLATTDAVVNFTPDMQVALQAQYDNISENFALLDPLSLGIPSGQRALRRLRTERVDLQRGFIAQVTQATIRLGHVPFLGPTHAVMHDSPSAGVFAVWV